MNKVCLILVALLLSGPAWAAGGGEGNNTNCNGKGNPNSPCNPSGGSTGGGGTGSGNSGGQGHPVIGGRGGVGIGVGIGGAGGAGGLGGAGGAGGAGGLGGAGGAASAAGGAATGGAATAAATVIDNANASGTGANWPQQNYPNPWFIGGGTTSVGAPGTMNPCAVSAGGTLGPIGYSETSESKPCVGMREVTLNPGNLSPWQYERMCVASAEWRTTDEHTSRLCYVTRQADAKNAPKAQPVPVAAMVSNDPPGCGVRTLPNGQRSYICQ